MAWIATTPKKAKVPRRVDLEIRSLRGDDVPDAEPPDLDFELEYLVAYLLEAGPIEGDRPLSWQELSAWQELTGARLDSFEAVALRRMSAAYYNMLNEAMEPGCPNPAAVGEAVELTSEQQQDVNDRLKRGLMAMAASNRKTIGAKKR